MSSRWADLPEHEESFDEEQIRQIVLDVLADGPEEGLTTEEVVLRVAMRLDYLDN